MICGILLLAYLAANGQHMATLFELGRGQYSAAIRFLAEESDGHIVTIGSDGHDLDMFLTLAFYRSAAMEGKQCIY
jgi:hypothetical protein